MKPNESAVASVGHGADTAALRKERGAFFTPAAVCEFVASWAVRGADDFVLEPSCGEASFLLSASSRLKELGAQSHRSLLHGVEVHAPSAAKAAELVEDAGGEATIGVADFFDVEPAAEYDAVIGNPPYIRYQQFSGAARAKALRAALAQGVNLTGLASSWAAFVIHATKFLKPEGRLGLVLPAELLSVKYAAPVRRYLLERFEKVRLVMFEELLFPDALEDVVLLLAEGTGPGKCFEVYEAIDAESLRSFESLKWNDFAAAGEAKWTHALLGSESLGLYRELVGSSGYENLATWGRTYLGAVTGNNKYFTLTAKRAAQLRLRSEELRTISPPGSRHLRGTSFTQGAWTSLREDGSACYLFYPDAEKPSSAALNYIHSGEKDRVSEAYKCRNRHPWWQVPLVETPDLLLTYMDQDRPRIISNDARVHHLNSIYGIALAPGRKQLGKDLLSVASLNSVSLLGSEIVGRAYGGGMLKLEPREADFIPVPSRELISQAAGELRALRPQLSSALRQGKVSKAAELVDAILLAGYLGVRPEGLEQLRHARESLFSRRIMRGKSGRGEN